MKVGRAYTDTTYGVCIENFTRYVCFVFTCTENRAVALFVTQVACLLFDQEFDNQVQQLQTNPLVES